MKRGGVLFDITAYLGWRLWQGAELWINPEIDQGFGLSGTVGIAGFKSGEAYKIGSSYPYARLQRTFIRQTINLGGDSEKVEGAANQFDGSRTSNRPSCLRSASSRLPTYSITTNMRTIHARAGR